MKTDAWHCAGWSEELGAGPVGRRLLGRPIVLFRDASGTARAVGARCPHRGGDLTQGSVVDGCLQCPFHGWRFDGSGRCVRVPSQPASVRISAAACVPSFRLLERQGVLWVWIGTGDAENAPPPDPPWQPGRSVRRLGFAAELVDAPLLQTLENAFDKAHLPFIHRGTFGPDQDPLVALQRITEASDGSGLRAGDDPDSPWHGTPKVPRGWVGWVARLLGLRAPVAQHVAFAVPGIVQIYLEYPNGTYDRFVTYVTPADDAHTWLFVESVRTRAPHVLGDWVQRRAIGKVLEEGKRETSLVLAAGLDDPARRSSVESDRLGLAVRRLYERWAAGAADPSTTVPARADVVAATGRERSS